MKNFMLGILATIATLIIFGSTSEKNDFHPYQKKSGL